MPDLLIKQQIDSLLKRAFAGRKGKAKDTVIKDHPFTAYVDDTVNNKVTNAPVEPVAFTTEEMLCTMSANNADEGLLSEQKTNIIEPTVVSNIDISSVIASRQCIKANLTKINKRDVFGNPRYDNLDLANDGDIVKLEYLDDTKTYLVLDKRGNELGEIGAETTSTILKSSKSEIVAIIDKITGNEEGKYVALINSYV